MSKAQKTKSRAVPQTWLQIAQLRTEKCELKEARTAYILALQQAKKSSDLRSTLEALAGLLRLASEALDEESIQKWERELDRFMRTYPRQIHPMAWYCKGTLARHRRQYILAQRFFHHYLRAVRSGSKSKEATAKGWIMLATLLQERHRLRRSEWLANEILHRYEKLNLHGINGFVYFLLGTLSEYQKDYQTALKWLQKAYAQFLGDHNWYSLLYVLYSHARIKRRQKNYSQADWYLDLVDKAVANPEFSSLRQKIARERTQLEQDAVDLLIDSKKGVVKTREGGLVFLRKQYILLHILEALSKAHSRTGSDQERGLSKAEIIEYVWKENYQPSIHDNKLYYNINRLRKLLEPDVRNPQYLLNCKEGYRLAPELRIHSVDELNYQPRGTIRQ